MFILHAFLSSFISLTLEKLTNLILAPPSLCLEPSKKFVVVGGGGCLYVKIVIGFGKSLGLGLELKAKLINNADMKFMWMGV